MSKQSKSNQDIEKHLQKQEQEKCLLFKHEQRLRIYASNPLVYFRRLQYSHENPDRPQCELSAQEHREIEDYIHQNFKPEYLRKLIGQNNITVLTGS